MSAILPGNERGRQANINIHRLTPLLGLGLVGCGLPGWPGGSDTRELAARTAFWRPQGLLAAPAPYPKLYVEVDAVEGSVPGAADLVDLRAFLAEHTDKPGGIRVVLDDVIPGERARGRRARSLALEWVDGPPGGDSAFLYVFVYDSRELADRRSRPATTLLPYPFAIFFDRAYGVRRAGREGGGGRGPSDFGRLALRHEAGHVLGLCRDPAHSDGLHCTDPDCLMSPALAYDVSRDGKGGDPWRQRDLCAPCRGELRAGAAAMPDADLRFRGPYLVRSEPGYQVLSLPGLVYVHLGSPADLDPARLAEVRRRAILEHRRDRVFYTTSVVDRAEARALVPVLLTDPYDVVRDLGRRLQRELSRSSAER